MCPQASPPGSASWIPMGAPTHTPALAHADLELASAVDAKPITEGSPHSIIAKTIRASEINSSDKGASARSLSPTKKHQLQRSQSPSVSKQLSAEIDALHREVEATVTSKNVFNGASSTVSVSSDVKLSSTSAPPVVPEGSPAFVHTPPVPLSSPIDGKFHSDIMQKIAARNRLLAGTSSTSATEDSRSQQLADTRRTTSMPTFASVLTVAKRKTLLDLLESFRVSQGVERPTEPVQYQGSKGHHAHDSVQEPLLHSSTQSLAIQIDTLKNAPSLFDLAAAD